MNPVDGELPGFVFDHSINLYTCLTCGWSCPESEAFEHECPESYLAQLVNTGLMTRRVVMRRKKFDRKLYAKYDQKAKEFALAELKKVGLEAEEHRLKTHVDLVVEKDGEVYFYVETEIKTALDGDFPYETLQLPHRKEKFCGLDKPTLFMLFSSNGKRYFCVWDQHVVGSGVAEVSNKYIKGGEFFFQIPLAYTDRSLKNALKRLDGEIDQRTESCP